MSAIVLKALSARGKHILYALGHGGWHPEDELPTRDLGCDCTGFVAWALGVCRQCPDPAFPWYETTAIVHDALGDQRHFVNVRWQDCQPGDCLVYGDRKDKDTQGDSLLARRIRDARRRHHRNLTRRMAGARHRRSTQGVESMSIGSAESAFIIFAVTNLGALLGSHVRQTTKLDALRDDVNIIRKRLGLMNGDAPAFIPRMECDLRESGIRERLERMETLLKER
jgi:hypothetical protein